MRTVVIIPAHNERGRVGRVARVAMQALLAGTVQRVIVVDDGSTDGCGVEALEAGAELVRLNPNRGKGGAMRAGLAADPRADVVLFLDADLLNLTPEHLRHLVVPVVTGQAEMSLGLRDYGPRLNLLQRHLPPITGERAVRGEILRAMPDEDWSGFRIEAGINESCRRMGGRTAGVLLSGLTIVPKWHKCAADVCSARGGFLDAARMGMEVLQALADVRARVVAPPLGPFAVEAMVPAHNEAGRVGVVVRALLASGRFRRVLVVDDGSTDGTAAEARAAGAEVLELKPNRGKGGAMRAGLRLLTAPWVAFFDADLVGLTPAHASAMCDEAATGLYGMVTGTFVQKPGPFAELYALHGFDLTGQRIVHRSILRRLPARYWNGYAIEVSLDEACARIGYAQRRMLLEGMRITTQREKLGSRAGLEKTTRILTEALRAAAVVRADASW